MDSTDNIVGIEGIGEGDKKHPSITQEMKERGEISRNKTVMSLWALQNPTEEEMYKLVRDAYVEKYGVNYLYYMLENYILLKMISTPKFDYPENIVPISCLKNIDTKRKLIKL